MKKIIQAITAISILSWQIKAQTQDQNILLPIKLDYKWGFIDPTGKIVIQPAFDYAEQFSCNLAKIKINGGYGVIDNVGKLIINPNKADVTIFCPRYIGFRKDSLWGLNDNTGKILVEPIFNGIEPFSGNTYLLKKGNAIGLYNTEAAKLIEATLQKVKIDKGLFLVTKNQKPGVYDRNLNEIVAPDCNNLDIIDSNAIVVKQKDFWSLVDRTGLQILKPDWMAYKKIGQGFLQLKAKTGGWFLYSIENKKIIYSDQQDSYSILSKDLVITNKAHKHGLVDKQGIVILAPVFSNIHLNENLLLVEQNGKWGLADKKGKMIIEPVHSKLFPFRRNLAVFGTETGSGIIDNKGKILVSPIYSAIDLSDNTAKATKKDGSTIVLKLDQLAGIKTGTQTKSKNNGSGHAWLKGTTKKWGLVGHDTVFIPYKFDEVIENDDFSIVGNKIDYRTDSKMFGYINQQKMVEQTLFKMGLVNKNTGKIILQPSAWYIKTNDFETGEFAKIVFEGGQQGLISKTGKLIQDYATTTRDKRLVKQQLNYVGTFKKGVAPFCSGCLINYSGDWNSEKTTGGKWGFINDKGKVIAEPKFDEVSEITNGRAIVRIKGFYGVVSDSGTFILKPEYTNISFISETGNNFFKAEIPKEKYGIINTQGKIIAALKYDKIFPYKEGMAKIMVSGKYGFIDEAGKIAVIAKFDNANDFSEGMASVSIGKKWGYVNKNGEQVILPLTPFAGNFKNGLAPVSKDGKIGYINYDSKIIVPPFYNAGSDFNNGVAIVILQSGKKSILDTTGKLILEKEGDEIKFLNNPRFLKIRDESEWKLFDKSQKKIISKKSFSEINDFYEGFAVVKTDESYTYIDSTGKILSNKKFDQAFNFSDGFARVKVGGKMGFINSKGEMAIGLYFNNVTDFGNGRAFSQGEAKLWSIIDKNGKSITFDSYISPKPFSDGFSLTSSTNKEYFFVDTIGKSAFHMKFENAYPFLNGITKVKNKKWGISNNLGVLICDYKYDYMDDFNANQSVVGSYTASLITDLDGKIVVGPVFGEVGFAAPNLFKSEDSDSFGYIRADKTWLWEPQK